MDRRTFIRAIAGFGIVYTTFGTSFLNVDSSSANTTDNDKTLEGQVYSLFNTKTLTVLPDIDPSKISYNIKDYSYIPNYLTRVRPEIIKTIVDACNKSQDVYPIPTELQVALYLEESSFDSDAVSCMGALGLAQLMLETDEGLDMDTVRYPDRKHYDRLKQAIKDYHNAPKQQKAKFRTIMQETQEKFVNFFSQKIFGMNTLKEKTKYDNRLNPYISGYNGVKYYAECCKIVAQKFPFLNPSQIYTLGLVAYNAGPYIFSKKSFSISSQSRDLVDQVGLNYKLIVLRRQII